MSRRNQKKTNLKSSILILLLLAILLIASTYAWFTANRTVTISTLDVHVEAANGIQISADGSNWKAVLTNEDITPGTTLNANYSANKNQIATKMAPVSTIGETNADGTMKMFYGVVAANATSGAYELTATQETDTRGTAGKYIAFDMFLKSDADTTLTLTDQSGVSPKDGSPDLGLQNSSRLAFIQEGFTADVSATAATVQALTSATPTTYIWEPNFDAHTSGGITNALNTYGQTVTNGGAQVPYYGIKAPIPTGKELKDTNGTKGTISPTYFQSVTPNYTTVSTKEAKQVFSISKGITKFRVYMWIEGQDVDCENTASGTDISFDVQLTSDLT